MPTPTFTVSFALSTGTFVLVDTLNWGAQVPPVSTANVNGNFKITAPDGTVIWWNQDFNNANCDIDIQASTTNQTTIYLPKNSDGTVVTGQYTFLYSVYDSNLNTTYTATQTFDNQFAFPTVVINQTVDCLSPMFTSQDATNYTVNDVLPTITRTHKVTYPTGANGNPVASQISSSAAQVQTGTIYSGTMTTSLTSVLSYTFSDGLVVTGTITGVKSIEVDCTFICAITCCLNSLDTQLENARCANTVRYEELKEVYEEVMAKVALTLINISCGQTSKVNSLITKIKQLSNCQDDCGCSDSLPSLIQGLGGQAKIAIVESCNENVISVEAETVGNTTTYTICMNSTLVTKLNNAYNTVVAAGDSTITIVDSGVVNGVRTFTLTVPQKTYSQWMSFRAGIVFDYVTPSNAPTVTISNVVISQSSPAPNFQSPTMAAASYGQALPNQFLVNAFQVSTNNTYKVHIEEILNTVVTRNTSPVTTITGASLLSITKPFCVKVFNQTTGAFSLQFVATTNGDVVTPNELCATGGFISQGYYDWILDITIYQ